MSSQKTPSSDRFVRPPHKANNEGCVWKMTAGTLHNAVITNNTLIKRPVRWPVQPINDVTVPSRGQSVRETKVQLNYQLMAFSQGQFFAALSMASYPPDIPLQLTCWWNSDMADKRGRSCPRNHRFFLACPSLSLSDHDSPDVSWNPEAIDKQTTWSTSEHYVCYKRQT